MLIAVSCAVSLYMVDVRRMTDFTVAWVIRYHVHANAKVTWTRCLFFVATLKAFDEISSNGFTLEQTVFAVQSIIVYECHSV